jgi:hypothetical protein
MAQEKFLMFVYKHSLSVMSAISGGWETIFFIEKLLFMFAKKSILGNNTFFRWICQVELFHQPNSQGDLLSSSI